MQWLAQKDQEKDGKLERKERKEKKAISSHRIRRQKIRRHSVNRGGLQKEGENVYKSNDIKSVL